MLVRDRSFGGGAVFQKKGVGTRRLKFLAAPPSNLTRLCYNGSAAKSHSITTQYRQLRRLVKLVF